MLFSDLVQNLECGDLRSLNLGAKGTKTGVSTSIHKSIALLANRCITLLYGKFYFSQNHFDLIISKEDDSKHIYTLTSEFAKSNNPSNYHIDDSVCSPMVKPIWLVLDVYTPDDCVLGVDTSQSSGKLILTNKSIMPYTIKYTPPEYVNWSKLTIHYSEGFTPFKVNKSCDVDLNQNVDIPIDFELAIEYYIIARLFSSHAQSKHIQTAQHHWQMYNSIISELVNQGRYIQPQYNRTQFHQCRYG